jgi:transposase-like protein
MSKQDKEIKEKFVNLILDELTIKAVCSKLNLSRQTVYRWMKEDLQFKKDIKHAIENCVLDINDDCESRILAKIRNDDTNMIKFWLRYRHPDYKQSYIVTK